MKKRFLDNRFDFLFNYLFEKNLDALFISQESTIRFFTDFQASNAFLIVKDGKIIVITDPRYALILEEQDSRIVKIVNTVVATEIDKLLDGDNLHIGCDFAFYKSSVLSRLRKYTVQKSDISDDLLEFVSKADHETLKRFNRANDVTSLVIQNFPRMMASGMKEYELRAEISYLIHTKGCDDAFTPIVAFGSNTAKIHSEPTDKILEDESAVLIDFGVKYQGVSTDVTRSFWFGDDPPQEYLDLYKIVDNGLFTATRWIRPSASCAKAGHITKQYLRKNHNNEAECLPHALGHGLGYDLHQFPRFNSTSHSKFISGQIISLEPGIYIPDKYGIRIENNYLITNDGLQLLTK